MRYKKHGVLLESAEPWQEEKCGFNPEGKWDCIVRSAVGAMAYDDLHLLAECGFLLQIKRRWSDELKTPKNGVYGSPKRMTRDPYIMTYCATHLMGYSDDIKQIKIPWYCHGRILYRPHVWRWRKYLINPTKRNKRIWEFLEKVALWGNHHKIYSLVLKAWRAYVGESLKLRDRIGHKNIPPNNYLLFALCYGSAAMNEVWPEWKDYQPRIRNYWTAEPEDAERLPLYEHDEYQIDKDILIFILNR